MNECTYIFFRQMKAWINQCCFYLCRVFPIKKNRISVCTFEGRGGFGCNPKYLVKELHRRNQSYEFIWFVNDMEKQFPSYIKKVPNTLLSRAYWLSTSKIWIDNYRKPYGTCKRENQYYMNVNHYTIGIKCTGLWRGKGFSRIAYLVSKNDSDIMDSLVIDSRWCEIVSPKGLLFSGPYLKTGAPRCDILFNNRLLARRLIREKHGLPKNAKIVMYAPTFREGVQNGKRSVYSREWSIDFRRLLMNLDRAFCGKWYICTRVHPQLASMIGKYKNIVVQNRMFDESQADDMYEILAGMDAYITDYSSAAFEAGFARIPVFIYADDIQTYASDRGSLMWNLATDSLGHVMNNRTITPEIETELPFSVATDNYSLECNIKNFDMQQYCGKLDKFSDDVGLVFDGKASQRLADVVESEIMK